LRERENTDILNPQLTIDALAEWFQGSDCVRIENVLGLSKAWHPDWGGLLQFYEEDGTPGDAWIPHFNCLNLFDIRHIHSVTYVTPFAGEPRLSLTGWFRSTP
jgi:Rps23 Pro-64 3,4-dihydroxylase Tpa1-like proline 4-hydroxylase